MSLINDALRRAQSAEPLPPPPPPGHFRPVEPQPQARHALGLLVPIALVFIALLVLLLVWEMSRSSDTPTPVEPRARARASVYVGEPAKGAARVPTAPAAQPPVTAPSQSSVPGVDAKQASTLSPAPVSVPAPATTVADANPGSESEAVAIAATNSPAVSNALPAVPVLPKLQGLVYNPRRPCVVLNGKTVFTGERIGAYRVVAIGPDSVTLVGAGQTNVLSLSD